MIDPVATLGLAGNIVQFVDFSWKLWCETKDLYDSSSGVSAEHDILELVTRDLIQLDSALNAPANARGISAEMRSLATRCRGVAMELLKLLEKIKVVGPRKKWKSFVMAMRSVWKKEQIESLMKRMETLRNEMQLRLQWMMR